MSKIDENSKKLKRLDHFQEELNNLSDFNFKLKTNFTIPAEVWQISNDSFDETRETFDDTTIKFDAA